MSARLKLGAAWRAAFAPPDRRPIEEWGADYVDLPPTLGYTGKFNPSPGLKVTLP